jgi:hypothetical protein
VKPPKLPAVRAIVPLRASVRPARRLRAEIDRLFGAATDAIVERSLADDAVGARLRARILR